MIIIVRALPHIFRLFRTAIHWGVPTLYLVVQQLKPEVAIDATCHRTRQGNCWDVARGFGYSRNRRYQPADGHCDVTENCNATGMKCDQGYKPSGLSNIMNLQIVLLTSSHDRS